MTPEAALELLRPALETERPLLRIDDLRAQLEASNARVWAGERSAIFTQFTAYPQVAELICEAGPAGGDLHEIREMIPRIEAWARVSGCTQAMITAGRRGWARALRDLGYEEYSTTLRKLL